MSKNNSPGTKPKDDDLRDHVRAAVREALERIEWGHPADYVEDGLARAIRKYTQARERKK